MFRVVIGQSFDKDALEFMRRRLGNEFEFQDLGESSDDDRIAAYKNADAIVSQLITTEMARQARRVKLLQAQGAGVDDIAVDYLPDTCYLANVFEHGVAISEYVIMVMLALSSDLLTLDHNLRHKGDMSPAGHYGGRPREGLFGKTIGIVGFGRIGQQVAKRAQAFGMRVIATKRSPDQRLAAEHGLDFLGGHADLDRVLKESDYVLLATPLTEDTNGLIGDAEFARMKPTAYIINVGRGPISQEQPLYDALKDRRIAGAGLDVWFQYPPPGTFGPVSRYPLHEFPNIVMTPHMAGWTQTTVYGRMAFIADNVKRVAMGEKPLNFLRMGGGKG